MDLGSLNGEVADIGTSNDTNGGNGDHIWSWLSFPPPLIPMSVALVLLPYEKSGVFAFVFIQSSLFPSIVLCCLERLLWLNHHGNPMMVLSLSWQNERSWNLIGLAATCLATTTMIKRETNAPLSQGVITSFSFNAERVFSQVHSYKVWGCHSGKRNNSIFGNHEKESAR